MLRTAGVCLILLSGALLGNSLNRGLRQVLAEAQAYGRLVRWIKLQIHCFSIPIEEILMKTDRELLRDCGWREELPPRDLRTLLREHTPLDGEIERILGEFSEEFGRAYREEQVARCDYYLTRLDARAEELRNRIAGKRRVNLTLCSAGAGALVILLI